MKCVGFAFLVLLLDVTSASITDYIQIAAIRNTGLYNLVGQDIVYGLDLWADRRNTMGGIPIANSYYGVNITYFEFEVTSNGTSDILRVETLVNDIISQNFDLLIGSYGAHLTQKICNITEENNIWHMSPGGSSHHIYRCTAAQMDRCRELGLSKNDRIYPHSFTLLPSAADQLSQSLQILANNGATTAYLFTENLAYTKTVVEGARNQLQALKYTIVQDTMLAGMMTEEAAAIIAAEVKALDPDAFVGGVVILHSAKLMADAFEAINFVPKSIIYSAVLSYQNYYSVMGDLGNYVLSGTDWDYRFTGVDFDDVSEWALFSGTNSSYEFAVAMNEKYGLPIKGGHVISALACATGVAIEKAVNKAGMWPVDTELAVEMLNSMYEPSFYGRLTYNIWGMKDVRDPSCFQQRGTAFEILAPISSSTGTLVYPMPQLNERVFDPGWFRYSSEYIIAGATALASLIFILILSVVIIYRKHLVIRISTLSFSIAIIVGCLVSLCSIWCWMLHETEIGCRARLWLLSLGFTLATSSLFAKNFRIGRIFTGQQLKRYHLSDAQLAWRCLSFILIEILYNLIWISVSPFTYRLIVPDPLRPSLNYYHCGGGGTFLTISLVMKYFVLFVMAVQSYRIRKLPSTFNESGHIAVVVYGLFFSTVVAVPVLTAGQVGSRETLFVVRSMLIILCSCIVVLVLFIPKLVAIYLYTGDDLEGASTQKGSKDNLYTTQMNTQVTDMGNTQIQVACYGSDPGQQAELQTQIDQLVERNNCLRDMLLSAIDRLSPDDPIRVALSYSPDNAKCLPAADNETIVRDIPLAQSDNVVPLAQSDNVVPQKNNVHELEI